MKIVVQQAEYWDSSQCRMLSLTGFDPDCHDVELTGSREGDADEPQALVVENFGFERLSRNR